MTRLNKNNSPRLANDGFDAIFLLLGDGDQRSVQAAIEVADALRNLPEGASDDDAREDLTIANLVDLVSRFPDEPAIQSLKVYIPPRLLLRPLSG